MSQQLLQNALGAQIALWLGDRASTFEKIIDDAATAMAPMIVADLSKRLAEELAKPAKSRQPMIPAPAESGYFAVPETIGAEAHALLGLLGKSAMADWEWNNRARKLLEEIVRKWD